MKVDTLRALFTYTIAILVLAGGFYALVINPYELAELVKGAIIGFMSAAISFVFGQEIAKQTAVSSQRAYDKGLATPTPGSNGTTVTPPANTTTTTTVTSEPAPVDTGP